MKTVRLFISLYASFTVLQISAQCAAGFIYNYTGMNNTVWFQDKSTALQPGWQQDYTQWQFSDGSPISTGSVAIHTFPQAQIYKVIMESKFSDPFNQANHCIVKDSLFVNAALATPPCTNTGSYIKTKWLSDSTYGVSSYYSGSSFQMKEACVLYGLGFTTPVGTNPVPNTIFSTSQDYFTYTLPTKNANYTFLKHTVHPPNCFTSSAAASLLTQTNIPVTPSGCHASFFLIPADTTNLNWTLLNYSSGSGSLTYLWNFGDGNTSTSATPSHTYAQPGTYTICLTVSSGSCSDTYCGTAITNTLATVHGMKTIKGKPGKVLSLNENAIKNLSVGLFPNPVKDALTVTYTGDVSLRPVFKIRNMLGQQVLQPETQFAIHGNESHQEVLNTEQLPSGVYLLEILFPQINGRAVWQKFIKD